MSYSFIAFLTEARSHAVQNPKVSVNQKISDAFRKAVAAKSKVAGVYNFFVSMTSIDKLGINPQSEYDTPLGIYAYPGQYVYKKSATGDELAGSLPFAGEMAHANIFSAQGNIINLGELSDKEVVALYKKIADVYHSYSKQSWKKDVDEVEAFINAAPRQAKVSSLPGGQLWYVTMQLVNNLESKGFGNAPVLWNKLFREIGVDGVIDMGNGIVHTNEPTQAVFFSTGAIDKVERVYNKYSPTEMKAKVKLGQKNITMGAKYATMSEAQMLKKIKAGDAEFLQYVKNPSQKVQLAAIEDSPYNIRYLKSPTEELQMMAIQSNERALKDIKNPSEHIQLAAIELKGGDTIIYIKNPSEQVQMAAVTDKATSIRFIKYPTEKVQLTALQLAAGVIKYIKNPTAAAKRYAAAHSV